MIYTNIPYCPKEHGKDIGLAYNKFMELLKPDDYAIFLDHDAMWTTYTWYHQIEENLAKRPQIEAFTCLTNRVFCKWQLANVDRKSNDIVYHREMGELILEKNRGIVTEQTTNHWMSGMMIGLKKSAWLKMGKFKSGMLGVDNRFHQSLRRMGIKLWLMNDTYVYHYYSNSDLSGKRDTSHLK